MSTLSTPSTPASPTPQSQPTPTGSPVSEPPVVLITGYGGLIGSRLVERLATAYRVVGMDLHEPQGPSRVAAYYEVDLTEDDSVGQGLSRLRDEFGDQLASVIHLAAYYDFKGEPSPLYDKLTVQGTRRLLEGLQEFQTEQFIFSSSLLVMEPNPQAPLAEDSPTQAKWDYPKSKLQAEAVIREHRGNIPAVIARIAGVYDQDCHSIPIAQQMARIYEKQLESYLFPGNAEHGNAFVHLDDLIEFFVLALERRGQLAGEEVFLVAEPDVVSYGELQDLFGEALHGREWPTLRIPKFVAKAGAWVKNKLVSGSQEFIKPWMIDLADDHYAADISHARSVLGWEPQHRLRLDATRLAERLKDNPARWYERNGLPAPESVKTD